MYWHAFNVIAASAQGQLRFFLWRLPETYKIAICIETLAQIYKDLADSYPQKLIPNWWIRLQSVLKLCPRVVRIWPTLTLKSWFQIDG